MLAWEIALAEHPHGDEAILIDCYDEAVAVAVRTSRAVSVWRYVVDSNDVANLRAVAAVAQFAVRIHARRQVGRVLLRGCATRTKPESLSGERIAATLRRWLPCSKESGVVLLRRLCVHVAWHTRLEFFAGACLLPSIGLVCTLV